ncbi:MAG: hypothetical protein LBQ47_03895, partial [Endomicrobium sp.]|nr:hypothetical protein [Endomicrobium sp.]
MQTAIGGQNLQAFARQKLADKIQEIEDLDKELHTDYENLPQPTGQAIQTSKDTIEFRNPEISNKENQLAATQEISAETAGNAENATVSRETKTFNIEQGANDGLKKEPITIGDKRRILKELENDINFLSNTLENTSDIDTEIRNKFIKNLQAKIARYEEIQARPVLRAQEDIAQRKAQEDDAAFQLADTAEKEAGGLDNVRALNKKYFGDDNRLKIVGDITAPNGRKAWGRFIKGLIEISTASPDTEATFNHEAAHKALNTFLTANEKSRLIDAFKVEIAGDKKLKAIYGKYLQIYKGNTARAVEETMADGFIGYAKSHRGFSGQVKVYFEKALNAIRNYLSELGLAKQGSATKAMYNDIVSGKFRQTKAGGNNNIYYQPLEENDNTERNNIIDITQEFDELKDKSAAEKETVLNNALQGLIGAEIETKDGKIIGIKEPQATHAKDKVLKKHGKQERKDIALLQKLEGIIKQAV